MFRRGLVVLFFLIGYREFVAQHLYYRNMKADSLKRFADTSNRIVFKGDTSISFKNHFAYVMKFFPVMRYARIDVTLAPAKRVTRSRPTFLCLFQSPEKRVYKLYLSTKSVSALDSVTLKNLDLNSQIGLIAREVSDIEDLSTSGFFDVLFWHFKQLSKRAKNKREYHIEQKVLEVGLGHQLLSLSRTNEEKLKIEKWTDARAYSFYFKNYRKRYMSAETITNFINDLPVYATHSYK